MPHFSIIIVSWNALHHLKEFLPSVAETDHPSYEIILADNASSDGSRSWVIKNFPKVKIATFEKNFGYCGGNNRAVPHTKGEILVFLNNDVKVKSDWLTELDSGFKKHPQAAAFQPKILSYSEPRLFEYAGAAGGFIDKYGYPYCRGRIFDTIEKDKGQYEENTPIFWASGAALAIRRSAFEEMGGFDEDFEFHMEEIDLCWKLWNRGHKVRYRPQSIIYHLGGGSLPMDSARKVYYNYRNNLVMFWKNYEYRTLIPRFITRLLLDGVAAMKELLAGNFANFTAIFRAHIHFYRSWFQTHQKRKELQEMRSNPLNPEIMNDKSIVWQYFVKGKKTYKELHNGQGTN